MFFFNIFDKLPRIFLEIISIVSILLISIIYFNYTENILEIIPILVLVIVSAIRLIPAFSGISLTLFYLRVYTPNVETVYDQIKEIRTSNHLNVIEEKLRKIIKIISILIKIILSLIMSHSHMKKNQSLLKNINLSIPKNSSISIMGPSGCGKSTLQSIIMGLIKPDKGNIYFENKNIFKNYDNWIKKLVMCRKKFFYLTTQ